MRELYLKTSPNKMIVFASGNSGIVHAGYDDKPGTNRAKFCWKGNQMFAQLDKELRFGYQRNGSLVLATKGQESILEELMERGRTNGVERLQILNQKQVREMEPHVNQDTVAALYSPDAGNVIPYEFAIALAENAVDNGVELLTRRRVTNVAQKDEGLEVHLEHWEPGDYVATVRKQGMMNILVLVLNVTSLLSTLYVAYKYQELEYLPLPLVGIAGGFFLASVILPGIVGEPIAKGSIAEILRGHSVGLQGKGGDQVNVKTMLVGGSGSMTYMKGEVVEKQVVTARHVINCAGGYSDEIAKMVGDDSFTIKPRLGDYLLLNRNQGHWTTKTLFPCPDPKLGKGVLVQTTLWGNLILGPTARDVSDPGKRDMSCIQVQEYILSKCKDLVPSFDPKEIFHGFCGARAKNSRGDWIIEVCGTEKRMIHVAGIDSPGLAGSPASEYLKYCTGAT